MKVAIVHDWITNPGGAETVIQSMLELFPDAPVYTSVYNKEKMSRFFPNADIRTSFLNRLPFAGTKYSIYLGLMPYAFEQFDLRGYDVVISSSTSCAKGVLTDANTLHICYCNTPMRYAWDFYFDYLNHKSNPVRKALIHLLMHKIRIWDVLSSNRVDVFIANSHNVAARIEKHYRRESSVIYPSVNVPEIALKDCIAEEYYLVVSRLVSYKRIDLAVQAFNELNLPLVIAGEGSEMKALRKSAGSNIRFVGRVSEEQKDELFRHCRGFVFPGEEDFGITPVEAQSYGKPVIAFGRGGAVETVINGMTGIHFPEQTAASLADAVRRAEQISFDPQKIRENALHFGKRVFKEKLLAFVKEEYQSFQKRKGIEW
jgi:glycosyltransferase involved in cell wall biosynthesis